MHLLYQYDRMLFITLALFSQVKVGIILLGLNLLISNPSKAIAHPKGTNRNAKAQFEYIRTIVAKKMQFC